MGAAPTSTAFVTAVAGNCEMTPILPSAGNGDGQESLQGKPGGASASEVASLILSGKEAAASGRQHDAEVDFLNACRNAAALQDGDPIPLSDAMYQLGRLYANAGALGSPKAKDLYQRAERLYSASLEGYRARYGDNHEKTRFAREGLVTVQQATGGKPPTAIAKAPPAPAAAPVAAAPPAAAPAAVAAASAPAPVAAAAPAVLAAPPTTAAPAATTELAKAITPVAKPNPESARPFAAPVRQARVREQTRAREDSTPTRESGTNPPPGSAEPVRSPLPEARSSDVGESPIIEQPRPRPQARRAPPQQESSRQDNEVADAPPPRRQRPVYVEPSESAAPSGGDAPQAEGSPNAP
jgi:hypothetical protein